MRSTTALAYDNRSFTSLAAISPGIKGADPAGKRCVQSYAMTGWRIGYVAAPAPSQSDRQNYLGHCTGSPCSISQRASAVALSASQEPVEELKAALRRAATIRWSA